MTVSHRRKFIGRTASILAGLIVLAGCTVQPLNAPPADFAAGSGLTSVVVEPVDTRVAQQVRNRLVFLLHGGRQATPATHRVELNVNSNSRGLLRVQAPAGDVNVTARRLTVTATVRLIRVSDDLVIIEQTRSASAAFDNTRQEFANTRALRDAEDRAARDVAEQLRIVVAAALAGS